MTNWTSGYVAEIGYTFGYFNELNPLRAHLAFLNAGLVCPEFGTACELGFGQGLSANIHSAASLCSWSGTDFNPAQASFAKELAAASGSGACLFDDSFAEFVNRDLPDFDYIGLHGIWSWISNRNRSVIVEFIRRKLKVGGVLYISYNTFPGWGPFVPMRQLMNEHVAVFGSDGQGIVSRINDAIEFSERLMAANPLYARVNPQLAERMSKLKEQNRQYLAHEYFNRDWHPMHFADMARWLAPAKLQYACSANFGDHVEALNLSPVQQAFLSDIPDAVFRQTVRDFMVNQQFRRDYWVKGARRLHLPQQRQALMKQRVILVSRPEDVKLEVHGVAGQATLSREIYMPIIQSLAGYKHVSVEELNRALSDKEDSISKVFQSILMLIALGHVHPVQTDEVTSKVAETTRRLNQHLLSLAKYSADVSFLASPVTGGGITVGRIQQLFLLSFLQGMQQPRDWVSDTWALLRSQGHQVLKAGRALQTDEESLAELAQVAEEFQAKVLPSLRGLRVY